MWRRSLKARVGLAHMILALSTCSAIALCVSFVLDRAVDEHVERILRDNMQRLESAADGRIRSAYLQGHRLGLGESMALPAYLRDLPPGRHEAELEDRDLEILVTVGDDAYRVVALDDRAIEDLEATVNALLLGAVTLFCLAAPVLGYWVSGMVIAPVTDLAREIRSLQRDAAKQALCGQWGDDEVGELAHAFEDYAQRLRNFLVREQDFTADVSHELRNPIMAASSSVELMLARPDLDDTMVEQVHRLRRAVERMDELVKVFLVLARGPASHSHRQTIDLARLAQGVVNRHVEQARRKGIGLALDVDDAGYGYGERSAASVVLENLVGNAVRHTLQGAVTVMVKRSAVTIVDTGAGIPDNDLGHIFERGHQGAAGPRGEAGLGLSIVQRICAHFGWEVSVGSRVAAVSTRPAHHGPAGTVAVLDFAPGAATP